MSPSLARFRPALLVLLIFAAGLSPAAAQNALRGPATAAEPAAAEAPGLFRKTVVYVQRMQASLQRDLTGAVRKMRTAESSGPFFVLAMLAFLYGIFHAAGPGHDGDGRVVHRVGVESARNRELPVGERVDAEVHAGRADARGREVQRRERERVGLERVERAGEQRDLEHVQRAAAAQHLLEGREHVGELRAVRHGHDLDHARVVGHVDVPCAETRRAGEKYYRARRQTVAKCANCSQGLLGFRRQFRG